MIDIVRCKKCRIPGPAHAVAHHEKTCAGKPCEECEGRGGFSFTVRVRQDWRECQACDGTGVKGGRDAIWKLHEEAIERYRADMAECR